MKRILIVPGWHGSGAGHWQSIWQEKWRAERIEQEDWTSPDPVAWVERLEAVMRGREQETVVVAHSLGVLTFALWASRSRGCAAGAFLVAPPDPQVDCPVISRFRAAQDAWLQAPVLVAGSEDDPYASLPRVEAMAQNWGAAFWNAGRVSHVNVTSGHGPWPEGQFRFFQFLEGLASSAAAA